MKASAKPPDYSQYRKPSGVSLFEENQMLRAQIEQQKKQIADYKKLIRLYEEAERLAIIQRFAAKSEKSKFQLDFFDEAELEQSLSELEAQIIKEEAQQVPVKQKPRKQRQPLSPDLPRVRVELRLSEKEKAGASHTFFSKVKEELDIIPAKVQVIEYWQEKAVFDADHVNNPIVAAKRPVHPLGKSIASTGLLAHILVAKYADALPLYRLESIFKRYGGNINRTTMANWIIRLNPVFMPLIKLLKAHQLDCDYLQADD